MSVHQSLQFSQCCLTHDSLVYCFVGPIHDSIVHGLQARDNAEDKWYCEHGEDNTTEHNFESDTNFEGNAAEDADWAEELEVAYTDAKRIAVSAWWAAHHQYAWAMDEIPNGLQQFVPADEYQALELDQQ